MTTKIGAVYPPQREITLSEKVGLIQSTVTLNGKDAEVQGGLLSVRVVALDGSVAGDYSWEQVSDTVANGGNFKVGDEA